MKQYMKFAVDTSLDRTISSLWDQRDFPCPTSVTVTVRAQFKRALDKTEGPFYILPEMHYTSTLGIKFCTMGQKWSAEYLLCNLPLSTFHI